MAQGSQTAVTAAWTPTYSTLTAVVTAAFTGTASCVTQASSLGKAQQSVTYALGDFKALHKGKALTGDEVKTQAELAYAVTKANEAIDSYATRLDLYKKALQALIDGMVKRATDGLSAVKAQAKAPENAAYAQALIDAAKPAVNAEDVFAAVPAAALCGK